MPTLTYTAYKQVMQQMLTFAEEHELIDFYPAYMRQNKLFRHLVEKHTIFTAENINGEKRTFSAEATSIADKHTMKAFRKFINTKPKKK